MSLVEALNNGINTGLYGYMVCLTFVVTCICTLLLFGLLARLIGGKPDKEEDDE